MFVYLLYKITKKDAFISVIELPRIPACYPKKLLSVGTNITGLDPGTSTIAAVSDDMVTLKELAPRCKLYNKQIQDLLRHGDPGYA